MILILIPSEVSNVQISRDPSAPQRRKVELSGQVSSIWSAKILPSTVTSDRRSISRLRFLIDKIIRADKTVVDKTLRVSLAITAIARVFAQCVKKIYKYKCSYGIKIERDAISFDISEPPTFIVA